MGKVWKDGGIEGEGRRRGASHCLGREKNLTSGKKILVLFDTATTEDRKEKTGIPGLLDVESKRIM